MHLKSALIAIASALLLLLPTAVSAAPADEDKPGAASSDLIVFTHPRTNEKFPVSRELLEQKCPDSLLAMLAKPPAEGDMQRSLTLDATEEGLEDHIGRIIGEIMDDNFDDTQSAEFQFDMPAERGWELMQARERAQEYYCGEHKVVDEKRQMEILWNFELRRKRDQLQQAYDKKMSPVVEHVIEQYVPEFMEKMQAAISYWQLSWGAPCLETYFKDRENYSSGYGNINIDITRAWQESGQAWISGVKNALAQRLVHRLQAIFPGIVWEHRDPKSYDFNIKVCPLITLAV